MWRYQILGGASWVGRCRVVVSIVGSRNAEHSDLASSIAPVGQFLGDRKFVQTLAGFLADFLRRLVKSPLAAPESPLPPSSNVLAQPYQALPQI